ncbi:MAG: RlmE family RNA methyltransferase [Alphaproteobacteria bacterium]
MAAGRRRQGGGRNIATRLRAGKGRSQSSRRWLERQLGDPYVAAAEREGWRSRAAFKLIDLDDRFRLLAPGRRVVDLGAAPGGWTQVAAERVRAGQAGGGRVVAIDLRPMDAVSGATVLEADALDPETPALALEALGGAADVVLSDMAAPATGHKATDHLRVMALCEIALAFAEDALAPGGAFVCKVLKGGSESALLAAVKRAFATVRHAKPAASRPDSAEVYLVATGFRGRMRDDEEDEA